MRTLHYCARLYSEAWLLRSTFNGTTLELNDAGAF